MTITGAGTNVNVNSWSPDSHRFAYVDYPLVPTGGWGPWTGPGSYVLRRLATA